MVCIPGPLSDFCRSFASLSLGRPPHFYIFPEPPAFLAVDVVSLFPGRLLAFCRKKTKKEGLSRIGPGLFLEVISSQPANQKSLAEDVEGKETDKIIFWEDVGETMKLHQQTR
jgi:hypothetical protein